MLRCQVPRWKQLAPQRWVPVRPGRGAPVRPRPPRWGQPGKRVVVRWGLGVPRGVLVVLGHIVAPGGPLGYAGAHSAVRCAPCCGGPRHTRM